jgi:hypothetical protein
MINDQEIPSVNVAQVKKPSSRAGMINDQEIPLVNVAQVKKPSSTTGTINNQEIPSVNVAQVKKPSSTAGMINDQEIPSVTVSTMKKSPSSTEMLRGNDSKKSTTLHHEENEISSASPIKIHVGKVSKNKVSASPETRANVLKVHSADDPEVHHASSLKTTDIRSPGRQRATTISCVDVRKIKPISDNDKLPANNTKVSVLHNNHNSNKVGAIDGVNIVLVKKD